MDNWGQGTFTLFVSRLYRRAIGIADALRFPDDLFAIDPESFWSIGLFDHAFETMQRDVSEEG